MHYLITPTGDLIDADPDALRRRVGAAVSKDALVGFVIRNLGYAGIARHGSSMAVKFAPARLKLRAYTKLTRVVDDAKPKRVSVSWFVAEWNHEIFPSVRAAIRRMSEIQLNTKQDSIERKYIAEPRALDHLNRKHRHFRALEAWREASGQLSIENTPQLFHNLLQGRYVVLVNNADNGRLVFGEIGPGLAMYRTGWQELLAGHDVSLQPDAKYARAVADDWRADLLSDEPRLIDVDANVWQAPDMPELRWRYTRLTLPIWRSDEKVLLSISAPNADIDFRSEGHQELEGIVNDIVR